MKIAHLPESNVDCINYLSFIRQLKPGSQKIHDAWGIWRDGGRCLTERMTLMIEEE